MKICESCGAKCATRALFCHQCGERFRVHDAESVVVKFRKEENSTLPLRDVEARQRESREDERLGEATSVFASTVASAVWTIFLASLRLVARLLRPAWRGVKGMAQRYVARLLAPANTWSPSEIPNFLYWGVLAACVWRLPTSFVGIVYAIMANDARNKEDSARARLLAESAKNWLIVDFIIGVVLLVFRRLVFRE
ncbi:MAG: CD225/dispanin family protein [Thermoguttaceae bacterium]|nr:CD225/dispanin family protein [Thermoguttaceae bacterium]